MLGEEVWKLIRKSRKSIPRCVPCAATYSPEVALRFEQAGIAQREQALASIKKSRPARAPVYRDGEHYHLDPHDYDLDLWAFRFGLRPPKVQAPPSPPRLVAPLPGPELRLSLAELEESWKDASLTAWSQQRLALAVLDTAGNPLLPAEVARSDRIAQESASPTRRRGSSVDSRQLAMTAADKAMTMAARNWVAVASLTSFIEEFFLAAVRVLVAYFIEKSLKASPGITTARRSFLSQIPYRTTLGTATRS
jgi:hypothetical protein